MSLKVERKPCSNIPPLAGGTYTGVCIAVVDLGKQYEQYDNQKQGKYVDRCMFIFEIPSERVEVDGEDKPRWISTKRLSQSLHERSNLNQILTTWRGQPLTDCDFEEGFDLSAMLGQPATLSVSVKEKKNGGLRNEINAISGLPKGTPAPVVESELLRFDADCPDEAVFQALPEWVQDIIRKSTQFSNNPPPEPLEFSGETAGERACPI